MILFSVTLISVIAITMFAPNISMGTVSGAVVGNGNNFSVSGGSDIQERIISLNITNNGSIYLNNDFYSGSGNMSITILGNRNIAIIGNGAGPNGTTIDDNKNSWIFNIPSTSYLNLINLTTINGYSSNGGTVTNNGTLYVPNCTFINNSATTNGELFITLLSLVLG